MGSAELVRAESTTPLSVALNIFEDRLKLSLSRTRTEVMFSSTLHARDGLRRRWPHLTCIIVPLPTSQPLVVESQL